MTTLVAGIGCRRGVSAGRIEMAVRAALGPLPFDSIRTIATVDTKATEPGLLAFCAQYRLPLSAFTRAQIAALGDLPGASQAVREHIGVDGVCEPCALLALPGGHLLVSKQTFDDVTVAIASDVPHSNNALKIEDHR